MIPVLSFPPPLDFDNRVRSKGLLFLTQTPNPNTKQFTKHCYWQEILPEMRENYRSICNYSATWIPHSTGQHSIDHFKDKHTYPEEAYNWDNFRYVSGRFNIRKGTKIILDPFLLPKETFFIDFRNFHIIINPDLQDQNTIDLARDTIKFLKFNSDPLLIEERSSYFFDYKEQFISFDYLERVSPFIAYEINRQGLKV